jgi:hypothetical protein
MDRRPLAVLALALLVALLAAWLFLRGSPPPVAVPRIDPVSSRETAQPAAPSATGAGDARSAAGVQRREDGQPLAGVEVFARALPTSEWSIGGTSAPLLATDLEIDLLEHGRKFLTDEHGIALVPEPDETLVVCARSDSLWGWTSFERGANEPAVLELGPAHDLELRVRNADGAPLAGTPVYLSRLDYEGQPWIAKTGSDGTLRIRNVEAILADQGLGPGELARVGLPAPLDPPVERWFDPRAFPDQPLELVVPACGALRVRLVGKPGAPLPADGDLHLRGSAAREIVVPFERGEARVPNVALGRSLEIGIFFRSGCRTQCRVDGPSRAGEELLVELPLDPRDALLVLPLVDEQGRPLAQRELEFARYELRPDRSRLFSSDQARVRTDEQGRLSWVLAHDARAEYGGEPSERIGWLFLPRPGRPALAAEVDLRGPFPPGLNERPAVVLKPDAPLVQGRVLDEQGAPVRDVTVALSRLSNGSPDGIAGIEPVRSSAEGRFEFHGPCLGCDLTLEVFARDYRLAPGEKRPLFRCGSSPSYDIRMRLLGRLQGRLLADPGVREFSLRLERAGSVQSARALRRLGAGFAIEFDALEPGEYSLLALSTLQDLTLARVDGLRVESGATCRDARLDPLDLRGLVPTRAREKVRTTIRVLDDQGRPLERGFAWYGPSGPVARWAWIDGRIEIPDDARGEIAVVAPHCALERASLEGSPRELRLRPALRARFVLDVPADLRGLGLGWELGLKWEGSSEPLSGGLFEYERPLPLDGAGELALEFPARCLLAGTLEARLPPERGAGRFGLELAGPAALDVREADGEQRIPLEGKPESWTKLRLALGLPR